VNVTASDHANVSAAGAIVSVRGTVRKDLRAAGAEVDVDARAAEMHVLGAVVSVKAETLRTPILPERAC
jgi:hypothetical protein